VRSRRAANDSRAPAVKNYGSETILSREFSSALRAARVDHFELFSSPLALLFYFQSHTLVVAISHLEIIYASEARK
jgi:hypothetical protein